MPPEDPIRPTSVENPSDPLGRPAAGACGCLTGATAAALVLFVVLPLIGFAVAVAVGVAIVAVTAALATGLGVALSERLKRKLRPLINRFRRGGKPPARKS